MTASAMVCVCVPSKPFFQPFSLLSLEQCKSFRVSFSVFLYVKYIISTYANHHDENSERWTLRMSECDIDKKIAWIRSLVIGHCTTTHCSRPCTCSMTKDQRLCGMHFAHHFKQIFSFCSLVCLLVYTHTQWLWFNRTNVAVCSL